MENEFETLISSFIEHKIGIATNFLTISLANELKKNLLNLNNQQQLFKAGTGNKKDINQSIKVRSDVIYWLDKEHNNKAENDFFIQIESFIKYLNMNCYSGIVDYEFHYSLYEIGCFYVKHIDQFKNDSKRSFSMISYLNNNWQPNDGGELMIYKESSIQKITPNEGKTILFKSNEMPHEVLLTNQPRMSVTGWLKNG